MKKDYGEFGLIAHCCKCGGWVCRSLPGSDTQIKCSKCGANLEVLVENTAVKVVVLNTKEQRMAAGLQ